jgi:hypothetical protein
MKSYCLTLALLPGLWRTDGGQNMVAAATPLNAPAQTGFTPSMKLYLTRSHE